MVRYSLPLALVLLTGWASPASAQQQSAESAPQTKRWTNADMDRLRAEGLISIVGPEVEALPESGGPVATVEPAPPAAPAAEPAQGPVYSTYLEDPAWYAEQAAMLQAELAARAATLTQAQANLLAARNLRANTGAVSIAATDVWGVTPDEAIMNLQVRVNETQARLDELADLARRNYIAPGVLRNAIV